MTLSEARRGREVFPDFLLITAAGRPFGGGGIHHKREYCGGDPSYPPNAILIGVFNKYSLN